MKIAIDAHMVGSQETGNERYIVSLIRALQVVDSTNTYLLLTDRPARLRMHVQESPRFQITRVYPSPASLRIPFSIPWKAWQRRADVLHMTYNAPPVAPCPTVITVHDISFKLLPQAFSLRDRLILSMLVPISMRRARKVIAVSCASKADISEYYRIPSDRIAVIPEAASDIFQPVSDQALLSEVRARYGTGESFILAVGNIQPRKNLSRLVEAYSLVRSMAESQHKLVIAGKAKWKGSQVFRTIQKHGLDDNVVFTGYVSDKDLVLLYNAACVFVYPSLYEGFGLPPLEAMACGTPVISSNAGAIPEVVADGGVLVSPIDVNAMASAIALLLQDQGLRQELIERGTVRAREFSWLETGRMTLSVYQEVGALT